MSDSESTISNANGTVIIQPPVVEVAEVNASESSTVSTIAENDSTTLIETSRVELISISQPQNDTLTLIQEEGQQTVIETKQIEIIEIIGGGINSIIGGDNITIDNTDPQNPIINASITDLEDTRNQTFKYTNGLLSGVEFSDGSFKVLDYLPSGQLNTLLLNSNGSETLKQFNYDINGNLTSINVTQV